MAEVITRFKVDSGQFDKKVKDAKKQLDSFASSIGVNMKAFSKIGVAAAAAGTAIKVIGDTFKKNEIIMDEWGRTVKSAGSLYDGFLNSLNTGNITGFLNRMDDIVNAAREAYDALDELGTFNAFNQINMTKAQAGLNNAIANYQSGKGSKADVQTALDTYVGQLQTRMDLEANAYEKSIADLAASRGVDVNLLKSALTGEFGNYKDLMAMMPSKKVRNTHTMANGELWEDYTMEFANKEEELGDMLRHFTDAELDAIQKLGTAQYITENLIATTKKSANRVLKGKSGTGSATDEPVYVDQNKEGAALAWDYYQRYLNPDISLQDKVMETVRRNPITVPVQVEIEEESAEELMAKVKTLAVQAESSWKGAAQAIASVGNALSQTDNKALNIAGIVAQAIANVALGLGEMLSQPQSTSQSWGWIALAASGAATMTGTIAAIKSATKGYAQGGIVGSLGGGMSSSGDNIVARLNKGEGVLTRAGIDNAEMIFNGGAFAGMQLETKVSGEDLRIALVNNNRRRGRITTNI